MATSLAFYFDFISPYAYTAFHAVRPLAARHGVALRYAPTLFARLLDVHGNIGPAEVPAKREYVFKDALRKARAAGLPFAPPPAHPFNPLLGLRIASLPTLAVQQHEVIALLFDRVWGASGGGITDPVAVARALTARGLDGEACIAQATTDEAKARVRDSTEEALQRGVFGVPTVVVERDGAAGELFWGVDGLPHLEAYLEGRDPVAALDLRQWANLPAESVRKGAPQR
jgi:2-hydroxychromene-2-carboxylate isomerase